MLAALSAALVDVPPTASLSQIRSLFAELTTNAEYMMPDAPESEPVTDAQPMQLMPSSNLPPSVLTDYPCGNPATAEDNSDEEREQQLRRLRQKKELLLLQREIEALQASSVPARRLDIGHVESMACQFSGDDNYDIRKWLTDVEDCFEILQLDAREKLVGARRLLSGTAKLFMPTVPVSTYDHLKQMLLEELDDLEDNNANMTLLCGATSVRELMCLLDRYEQIRPRQLA